MNALLTQTKPFVDFDKPNNPAVLNNVATIKGFEAIFYNLVVIALAVAGISLFIMLVVGGFKYLTAGGNQDSAQAARQTLTYAFIGFVVLVAAYLILSLIFRFTGVPITTFSVTK